MPLDEFSTVGSQLTALDVSGNDRHSFSIHGEARIVPDDTFGSCLSLNGGEDCLTLPNNSIPTGNALTMTLWACGGSDLPADTVLISAMDSHDQRNLMIHLPWGDGHIYFDCGNTGGSYDRIDKQGVDKDYQSRWTHWAFTKDAGTGEMRIYKDGVLWHSGTGKTHSLSPSGSVELGRGYLGKLAYLRIYDRALTQDEVQAVIRQDQTAKATYKTEHALDFHLLDHDARNVLYISEEATVNTVQWVVRNTSDRHIETMETTGTEVSEEHHHLRLTFKPKTFEGTIEATDSSRFVRAEALPEGWVASQATEQHDGKVSLYLLYTGTPSYTLNAGEEWPFTLAYGSAYAMGGARGTTVELRYDQLKYQGETAKMEGTHLNVVDIVNQRGKKNIPLHVGVVGSNTVLNDADPNLPHSGTASTLRIRLASTLKEGAIRFMTGNADTERNTRFTLLFDDPVGRDWDLATVDQLNAIEVTAQLEDGTPCQVIRDDQGMAPVFEITPATSRLAPGQGLEIVLSNLHTSSPSGLANLYLRYEDVPGYWDSQFVILVEKTPLIHRDVNGSRNVGIGVQPDADNRLRVDGNLSVTDGKVGIGISDPTATFQIVPEENASGLEINSPTAGNTHLPWKNNWNYISGNGVIFRDPTDQEKIRIDTTTGNVGIGTADPERSLHIRGDLIRLDRDSEDPEIMITRWSGDYGEVWKNFALSTEANGPNDGKFSIADRGTTLGGAGATKRLTIDTKGNVGIGTTDPIAKLHIIDIEQGANSHGTLRLGPNPNGGSNLRLGYHKDYSWIQSHGSKPLRINELGNNTILNLNSGRVGIGTTNPSAKLDVNGDIRVSGNVPIQFKRYSNLGDNVYHDTDFSSDDYNAAIVGFWTPSGDIQEDDSGAIMSMYMYTYSRRWHIRADFRSHKKHENWYVDVMFVRKELSSRSGY